MARPTDDKLPAGFQPVVGAKVPTQKKLPLHPLPRPLVNEIPALLCEASGSGFACRSDEQASG
jgi:hypothetical protein